MIAEIALLCELPNNADEVICVKNNIYNFHFLDILCHHLIVCGEMDLEGNLRFNLPLHVSFILSR